MYSDHINTDTKTGTISGTLLALLFHINWGGLFSTALVAAVGAVTSFVVSMGMNYLARKYFKKNDRNT